MYLKLKLYIIKHTCIIIKNISMPFCLLDEKKFPLIHSEIWEKEKNHVEKETHI
jgi:hypothetical protein